MNRRTRKSCPIHLCLAALFLSVASPLWAQPAAESGKPKSTLKQAFEAAWARQPEARSLAERRDAASARREAADSWLAAPPALEVSNKTDQITRNQGSREYVAGLALPLWLPGERARTAAVADAESRMVNSPP